MLYLLRFWNSDVMNNINNVMGAILEELDRLAGDEIKVDENG
jgi:very-short-patch-repair endonuclease